MSCWNGIPFCNAGDNFGCCCFSHLSPSRNWHFVGQGSHGRTSRRHCAALAICCVATFPELGRIALHGRGGQRLKRLKVGNSFQTQIQKKDSGFHIGFLMGFMNFSTESVFWSFCGLAARQGYEKALKCSCTTRLHSYGESFSMHKIKIWASVLRSWFCKSFVMFVSSFWKGYIWQIQIYWRHFQLYSRKLRPVAGMGFCIHPRVKAAVGCCNAKRTPIIHVTKKQQDTGELEPLAEWWNAAAASDISQLFARNRRLEGTGIPG